MFEIEIFFTDDFGADSVVVISDGMLNSLPGFIGVEYEVADRKESRWFNRDYIKEISSKRVDNNE